MEHSEAISTKAAERYLLGELNEADADAFEEHFFDCVLCADDVRDEAKIMEAGRAVARDGKANVVPIARRGRSRGWLQVAAAAILVIGIGISMLFIQRTTPLVASGRQATLMEERSGGANVFTLKKGEILSLYVDAQTGDYRWKVADVSGTSIADGKAGKSDTQNGFNLLLGDLPAGNYTLVMNGVQESDGKPVVVTRSFTIRK